MKLPNADRAIVDVAKLRDYCLSAAHRTGRHKARLFTALLGFDATDAERLRELILAAVLTHEAIERTTDNHGTRYIVDFERLGLHDLVTIRTAWIIDAGETIPRLVSCYVKRD